MPPPAMMRKTYAEVDVSNIVSNAHALARMAPRSKLMAVVKADAYGHGAIPVSRALEASGVDSFGVALAEEGFALRAAGIRGSILVFDGVYDGAHRDVIEAGLTPAVYNTRDIELFAQVARRQSVQLHLKLDIGMSRLGVRVADLESFVDTLKKFPQVQVMGAFAQLSSADTSMELVEQELTRFQNAITILNTHGIEPKDLHVANSAALACYPATHLNVVRAGISLYGSSLVENIRAELAPALRWVSHVAALRDVQAGCGVGYNHTFHASGPTRIATVPVGYADGLMRALSNKGEMLVRGKRCPIVGRISMDLTMIDVSHVAGAALDDEVVIVGSQEYQGNHSTISADEVASAAGTISYEVFTNISRRVPRLYRGNEKTSEADHA